MKLQWDSLLKHGWVKKFIVYIIGAMVMTALTNKAGFPRLFIVIFNVYAFACFLFYIIIDLPAMRKLTGLRAFAYLIATFALFSGLYSGVAAFLPQFNPEFELEEIRKPPVNLSALSGPEAIKAGEAVYNKNKCANCHKFKGTGTSMRGPHFDLVQIGLNDEKWLKEGIVNPRKDAAKGFEDQKSKTAMPTYFGEDISEDEMGALLAFLKTGWSKENMPVRGKEDVDPMVRWDEDTEMIAMGKETYEGNLYPGLNCSVCHGKDGISIMQGARDLRDPNSISKRPGKDGKKLKDWTDADWFDSVANGIPKTPMMPWLEQYPPRAIWLAVVYAKQFSKSKGK
ncbi:MAG: c-type cytochrome [Deltaproteobacteria bacterium]|nr:c-type cytochrome [Deltaproteobacteria bacterium]